MSMSIQRGDPTAPDSLRLVAELDAYLAGLYPPESNYGLSIEQLRQPHVSFFILRYEGEAVGCGAFVNVGGEYAEIKRMYVRPASRGLKLGRRMLEFVEDSARAAGLPLARLETGPAQPEALGLYERCGYVRRGPFGDYADDPLSVFMEKALQR